MGESEREAEEIVKEIKRRFKKGERMYIRLVAGGSKVRFTFGEKDGGSFLMSVDFLRQLLGGQSLENYAVFVPDTKDWEAKRDGR